MPNWFSIWIILSCLLLAPREANSAWECAIAFALEDNVVLGSLQWSTDYSEVPGYFVGSSGTVDCSHLVPGAIGSSNDKDDERVLTQGIVDLDGFTGPRGLSTCIFKSAAPPTTSSFAITTTEASDPDLNAIQPLPSVAVDSVQCDEVAPACGDGIAEGDEECDDGNDHSSDECLADCRLATCGDGFIRSAEEECDDANMEDFDGCSSRCRRERICGDATDDGSLLASDALRILQFAVGLDVECPTWICNVDGIGGVSAPDSLRLLRKSVDLPVTLSCGLPTGILIRLTTHTRLGALQLDIGYERVSGEIDGAGEEADCQAQQAGIDSVFNDKAERILSASFVSLTGMRGPGTLARCGYTPDGEARPEDFLVTVLEAKNTSGVAVTKPVVRVVPD